MMRHHKGLLLTVAALVSVTLSGCWDNRELDTLAIVVGIGVDRIEKGEIEITAQMVRPGDVKGGGESGGGSPSGGSSGEPVTVMQSKGRTVFEAIRRLTMGSERSVYLSHNQFIVIGGETARSGVRPLLDFFMRNPEARQNVWVLIAAGRASEVLMSQGRFEKIPAVGTAALIRIHSEESQTHVVTLQEFAAQLMSKTGAPSTASVEVTGGKSKIVRLSGVAVFKSDKLVGRFGAREARGLMWLIGEEARSVIPVEGPGGQGRASLEVQRSGLNVTGAIKRGRPQMQVRVKVRGILGEQGSTNDFTNPSAIDFLEGRLARMIRSEIHAALTKSQKWNTDVFGFGDALHRKYPREWKKFERRWDELFPVLNVSVEVETELTRTGLTQAPVMPMN